MYVNITTTINLILTYYNITLYKTMYNISCSNVYTTTLTYKKVSASYTYTYSII